MNHQIAAVILAAGKGTRLQAPPTKNKVVFELADRPIISYTYDMLRQAGLKQVIVVVGYASDSVRAALGDQVTYAVQENPQGTGHAVQVALPFIPPECNTVISMYGDDSAFYPTTLIETLVAEHANSQADVTLVTLAKSDPTGLGRIVRNGQDRIIEIVEEKNATPNQKQITEINTGLYCFKRDFLEKALVSLEPNQVTGEYYLTDVVSYAARNNYKIHSLRWPSDEIWFGVNTPEQLEGAHRRMLELKRETLCQK